MPKTEIVINVHGGMVQGVFASDELADVVVVDWDVAPGDEGVIEIKHAGQLLRASVQHPIVEPLTDLAGSELEAVIDAACEHEAPDNSLV